MAILNDGLIVVHLLMKLDNRAAKFPGPGGTLSEACLILSFMFLVWPVIMYFKATLCHVCLYFIVTAETQTGNVD